MVTMNLKIYIYITLRSGFAMENRRLSFARYTYILCCFVGRPVQHRSLPNYKMQSSPKNKHEIYI